MLIGLEEENYERNNVRKSFHAIKQISKDSFNSTLRLRMVLIGEQSVDERGPKREFFHL